MRTALLALALTGLCAPAVHAAPPFDSPFNPSKKPKAHKKPSGKAGPKKIDPPTPRDLETSCSGSVRVRVSGPIEVSARLSRGDFNLDGGAYLEIPTTVRHTKRRIFVEGQMIVQEKHPPDPFAAKPKGAPKLIDGDTRYAGSFQLVKGVNVPSGCEIGSVTPTNGSMTSEPHQDRLHTVYGSGVLDQARCRTDNPRNRKDESLVCIDLSFQELEVRFRPARVDCSTVRIQPPTSAIQLRERTEGDADMHGNRPHVRMDGLVQRSGDRVTLRTTLEMKEDQSDWTTYRGTKTLEVFDAQLDRPGCRIRSVSPERGRLRGQTRRKNEHRGTLFGAPGSPNRGPNASGVLAGAWCRTDANGPDARRLGCGEIEYNPITIQLERR